ncbi:MAG TPA: prephenate dehydrogenase/arogenate dehydrogenase family protein [Pyrinomonadaceae bacterium]|nr:prephenate dehydrogenase/arogenate dehydrogenase family protein [Pyrinomonadaceae bacterium]
MTPYLWNRVTIVGCGLIGASLGLALKQNDLCGSVAGWDSEPGVLDEALKTGVIDEIDACFASASSNESESDLIYLAMPVRSIISFLQNQGSRTKRGAVITDAGSTKFEICVAAGTYLRAERHFIGGHPIAGSHESGLSFARPDLFDSAPYVLIHRQADQGNAFAKVEQTVEALGSQVYRMRAAQHDQVMASLSHLPQLVSVALSATARKQLGSDFFFKLAGNGYRDMTRLADSSWSVWEDILRTNSDLIAEALDSFGERISMISKELRDLKTNPSSELSQAKRLFKASK